MAIALVQSRGGTSALTASIVPTLPGATTAGNTIVLFGNGAGTIATPSGFTSNSPQVNIQGLYCFTKLVASGNATDTPTMTMSGAFNSTWAIYEFSGCSAVDLSSGANAGFGTSGSYTTAALTPTAGNRVVVAFIAGTGNTTAATFAAGDPQSWTNSFTGGTSASIAGGGSAGQDAMLGGGAYLIVAATGVTSYTTAGSFTIAPGGGGATIGPATISVAITEASGATTKSPPPWSTNIAAIQPLIVR